MHDNGDLCPLPILAFWENSEVPLTNTNNIHANFYDIRIVIMKTEDLKLVTVAMLK